MAVFLHPIQTIVPEHYHHQEVTRDLMKSGLNGNDKTERLLNRIYAQSGIDKRHTVIRDFNRNGEAPLFWDEQGCLLAKQPGTGRRNELYIKNARPMFRDAAWGALQKSPFSPGDVTHVITVSCTGFFAPGPEYFIVRDLGLPATTQRYNIGFMGCYAAFPALRMANDICRSNTDAVVLIASVELCSLHMQLHDDMDSIVSNSVFADGGAGLVVSAAEKGPLAIHGLRTDLTEHGEEDMAWELGDQGFNMMLSSYVPKIIEANVAKVVEQQLTSSKLHFEDIDYWALHPGGRAILDKIRNALELSEDDLIYSRNVLKNYGNMSSATVLFVMQEILNSKPDTGNLMAAMAFGPGLTIESGIFEVTET